LKTKGHIEQNNPGKINGTRQFLSLNANFCQNLQEMNLITIDLNYLKYILIINKFDGWFESCILLFENVNTAKNNISI
jgi:hypothetical protein